MSKTVRLESPDGRGGVRLTIERAHGPGLAVSPTAAERLRTVLETVLETASSRGTLAFTREIPNASDHDLAALDPDGFVRVGTEVTAGDLLVGRVRLDPDGAGVSPEEKLLRSIFGESAAVQDASLRVPPGASGVVTEVRRGSTSGDETVQVVVTRRRELRVGDVLVGEDDARELVVGIGPTSGADLAGARPGSSWRVREVDAAEDQVVARSVGPYSALSQQPAGGQRVGAAELAALEAAGAWRCALELLTVKSDDPGGRVRAYEALVAGDPEIEPSPPESARILRCELAALAFAVDPPEPPPPPPTGPFDFSEPAPPPARAPWRLVLAGSAQIRASSHGAVDKPETLDARTRRPVPGGLSCSRIFGPTADDACECGKYTGPKDRGAICEDCGVEVGPSRVRRERFGHVELPVPCLHPLALELVALLLDRPAAEVEQVVRSEVCLDGSPPGDDWRRTGAAAIREALEALDLRALASGTGPRAALATAFVERDQPPTDLVYDAWPVLPPELRPSAALDDGRRVGSDLNDLYRRLVNRRNRLSRLLELGAPGPIVISEQQQLQVALDQLVLNGLRHGALTAANRRPLVSLVHQVARRLADPGKRVDFSARARVVPDPTLERGRIRLPRTIAIELFRPWVYGALERAGHATTIKGARRLVDQGAPEALEAARVRAESHPLVVFRADPGSPAAVGSFGAWLWDGVAVGMHPEDAAAMGFAWGEPAAIHVPLDARAVGEARALGVRPARGSGELERELRRWIVAEADCGAATRSFATCAATTGICAQCAGQPVGTPIGLQRAREGTDGGLLGRRARRWLGRAIRSGDPQALGLELIGSAIRGELDPVDDPETRSLLGRIGWDPRADGR